MIYRDIEDRDIEALFDVRVATWHNPHGREELTSMGITPASVRAQLASTHHGYVCEEAGRVVGFAIGNGDTGEMWVIAVLPEYEDRGIGRALMERIERWLLERGNPTAWLTTDPDENYRAVGFYRRLGWEDWKIEDGDRFMRKSL
ncbi:MAG: GNAT family N-acetyltransferase [Planctomycetota bacterium]